MPLYLIHEPSDEGSTPTLAGQLLDAAGQPVGVSQLDALWLTLFDSHSLAIINERTHVDALTLPGFTINELGLFEWVLSPEDMPVLDDCRRIETHVVQLEAHWTAESVPRVAYLRIALPVRNLLMVEDLGPPPPLDTADHTVMAWGEIQTTPEEN